MTSLEVELEVTADIIQSQVEAIIPNNNSDKDSAEEYGENPCNIEAETLSPSDPLSPSCRRTVPLLSLTCPFLFLTSPSPPTAALATAPPSPLPLPHN